MFIFQLILAWIAADLFTGIVRFVRENYVGKQIDLLIEAWSKTIAISAAIAWGFGCYFMGLPLFFIATGPLGLMAFPVQKWAQASGLELNRAVYGMQLLGIFQSKPTLYCALTDWLNWPLNAIRFWDGLTWSLEKIRIKPLH